MHEGDVGVVVAGVNRECGVLGHCADVAAEPGLVFHGPIVDSRWPTGEGPTAVPSSTWRHESSGVRTARARHDGPPDRAKTKPWRRTPYGYMGRAGASVRSPPGSATTTARCDACSEALRHEPCSPACANWLRYGIQPKGAKAGLTPGYCKNKAHRREYLGYAGRRVLVSRKWSGKTMADHKNDRKNWVLARLAEAGVSAAGHPTEPGRYAWELAPPGHPDVKPIEQRLMAAIAERLEMRRQLDQATTINDLSATQEAA
ncbi:replication initiator [Actinoallomurus acaciae]|uniref:Replication initiator n=1 Tax=Actinoallomurus acaciae TaxID=502577 RepID=A0ABV5YGK8_9ACTN